MTPRVPYCVAFTRKLAILGKFLSIPLLQPCLVRQLKTGIWGELTSQLQQIECLNNECY